VKLSKESEIVKSNLSAGTYLTKFPPIPFLVTEILQQTERWFTWKNPSVVTCTPK